MEQTLPLTKNSWSTRANARLADMSPAWFALVMGWCGLAQAWLRAQSVLGEPALGLALVSGGFALLLFVVIALACVVRLQNHPRAIQTDLAHPVRHAFMATLPISIMLLSALGVTLFWHLSTKFDRFLTVTWIIGSVLELTATVWVLGRWLRAGERGGLQWGNFTPALFMPVVGNVLAPLGGIPLGLEAWATAQFGIGLLLWPVLQTLLIVRLVQAGPLSTRMSPTLLITLAPPSVVGLSLLQWGASSAMLWAVWGIGLFFLCWSLTQVSEMRAQSIGLTHWGTTFPLAAFCALTLSLAATPQGSWLQTPAIVLLALTSLVLLGLSMATWRGLRQGTLLTPDA